MDKTKAKINIIFSIFGQNVGSSSFAFVMKHTLVEIEKCSWKSVHIFRDIFGLFQVTLDSWKSKDRQDSYRVNSINKNQSDFFPVFFLFYFFRANHINPLTYGSISFVRLYDLNEYSVKCTLLIKAVLILYFFSHFDTINRVSSLYGIFLFSRHYAQHF